MAASSDLPAGSGRAAGWSRGWFARLVARSGFQRIAARLPISGAMARRDGAKIFDIMQGFVASQVLVALVEEGVLQDLLDGSGEPAELAAQRGVATDRIRTLLQAGAALGLLVQRRDGRFGLARRGAAILGVPGLTDMIRHNAAFYRDMADPSALLRSEGGTELARIWPYVSGSGDTISTAEAARYSELMARSQELVAEDTLRAVRLKGVRTLLDVGGGSGVFLAAALRRDRGLRGMLLDLPEVITQAEDRLRRNGLSGRVGLHPGSFRDGALPEGADAISLIRVLYDHDDATVRELLSKSHDALPPGGRLIISEPMAGEARPDRAGDLYFAFYTMAMGTGRARSPARIVALCEAAGFERAVVAPARRPYVTRVVTCERPA
ncbi:methyltransferase [Salibaculum griseiflavum]|uniref:SAM-dependent methyltransferase n=1 Tax=Salibaculum griseiflavum TaxID=1914409 RepID=A0A2V1P3D9_9RHOB|nr:methyltransferase [Salibaculum griseiflavum]PWG15822.1 SAM-dependent methyltransferase [Salibaculum griseiflavum]